MSQKVCSRASTADSRGWRGTDKMIRIFKTYLQSHAHNLDTGDVSASLKCPSDPTAGFAAGFKAVGGLTGQQKGSFRSVPLP